MAKAADQALLDIAVICGDIREWARAALCVPRLAVDKKCLPEPVGFHDPRNRWASSSLMPT
ncbi:hypothetical protein ACFWU3_06425 [Streptomyces sp. NPDC058685]|uniref:hypothetical protein n=1 Tax=Streptomyces sp. NPDC058685 TaxID=3346598 RepID=UPI003654F13F